MVSNKEVVNGRYTGSEGGRCLRIDLSRDPCSAGLTRVSKWLHGCTRMSLYPDRSSARRKEGAMVVANAVATLEGANSDVYKQVRFRQGPADVKLRNFLFLLHGSSYHPDTGESTSHILDRSKIQRFSSCLAAAP